MHQLKASYTVSFELCLVPLTMVNIIFWFSKEKNNKHIMTGSKGNSEVCFPKTLYVPRGRAKGKENSLFQLGPVIITISGTQICHSFKEHNLITSESKVQLVVSQGS